MHEQCLPRTALVIMDSSWVDQAMQAEDQHIMHGQLNVTSSHNEC
jgi:hypothetical protein